MKELIPIGPDLNAYRFSFDESLLDEIRTVYTGVLSSGLSSASNSFLLEGGLPLAISLAHPTNSFHIRSYGTAPLLWISNNDAATFDLFKRFYESLTITNSVKRLVDYEKDIVVYCGFFVVGNHLDQELWHVDYLDGANAYTLITPLFELDSAHGNLLYADTDSRIHKYKYRLNEAIIFGDGFKHSTETYPKTSAMRVMVSLAFGTDKLKYWDIMKKTLGGQSELMMLPCGHARGTCRCLADP